jgi:hypothetical protein
MAIFNAVVIWNIFPRFGILCQEKSGNPARYRLPPQLAVEVVRRHVDTFDKSTTGHALISNKNGSTTGLPDGIFSKQKYQFG